MTTEYTEYNEINLIDWLTCTDTLLNLGFARNEIKRALEISGLTERDLTDMQGFDNLPSGSYPSPRRWEKNETAYITRYVNQGGRTYENTERAGYAVRVKGQYQGLKHERIVRILLAEKLPFFTSFKWDIYSCEYSNMNYEIYLKTKKGSVYVPVKALLAGDVDAIKKRMDSYQKDYHTKSGYQLNHKQGESFEDFQARKIEDYKKALAPLKSGTTTRLFKMMKGGK